MYIVAVKCKFLLKLHNVGNYLSIKFYLYTI